MKILKSNTNKFNHKLDQLLSNRRKKIRSKPVSTLNIINDIKKKW